MASQVRIMRTVGIDVFLWRAGDVNPLIDRVDTAKIRGLTSPARRTQPQSNPREVYIFTCRLVLRIDTRQNHESSRVFSIRNMEK